VLNLQSKRTVSGVVTGRGQVSISVATPRLPATADATSSLGANQGAAPISVAANASSQLSPKAE
jgi:flagellar basal body P-ring formation protein FlgA